MREPPVSPWARLLAGAGLTAAVGLLFYVFYLMAAGRYPDPGPVLAGRPLPCLALQALAAAAVGAGAATATAWRRAAGRVAVRPLSPCAQLSLPQRYTPRLIARMLAQLATARRLFQAVQRPE